MLGVIIAQMVYKAKGIAISHAGMLLLDCVNEASFCYKAKSI